MGEKEEVKQEPQIFSRLASCLEFVLAAVLDGIALEGLPWSLSYITSQLSIPESWDRRTHRPSWDA